MARARRGASTGQVLVRQQRAPGATSRPLNDVLTEAIRTDIIEGRFQPGDRLAEERLALEYEVSRNPIREAIQRLQTEGFVSVEPNRGATVCHMSDEQAHELLQAQSALETVIVRLAAERHGDDRCDELRRIVDRGRKAAKRGDLRDLPALNSRFHSELALASGNATLAGMMAQLRDKIAWIYASEVDVRAPYSWDEHAEIVDAIEAGDKAEASRLMERHIDNSDQAYVLRHQS